MEDQLWAEVLLAIAEGDARGIKRCAMTALKTMEIEFPRWRRRLSPSRSTGYCIARRQAAQSLTVAFLPTFQAQNPAISGYRYGWISCTAFSAAMVASYDQQTAKLVTGGQVREQTGDHVGGLNLNQVDDALQHWNVDLDVRYRLPFDDFVAKVNAGRAAILTGGYTPIAASRYDAGNGFRGNHAIAVFPGLVTMDPLADGRYANVYKYHGEAYPANLLRAFAGALDFGPRDLGDGLVYAAFSHDRVAPGEPSWYATIRPGGTPFTSYVVAPAPSLPTPHRQIRGRSKEVTGKGFSLHCSPPTMVWERPVGDGVPTVQRSLVQIGEGSYSGWWVDRKWAEEK